MSPRPTGARRPLPPRGPRAGRLALCVAVRVAGSWIVAIGLLMLGWSLRGA